MNTPVSPELARLHQAEPADTARGVLRRQMARAQGCSLRVEQTNPGTGDSLGKAADCGAEDIDAAVKAAKEAFKEWRRVPPLERARVLKQVARVLRG